MVSHYVPLHELEQAENVEFENFAWYYLRKVRQVGVFLHNKEFKFKDSLENGLPTKIEAKKGEQ